MRKCVFNFQSFLPNKIVVMNINRITNFKMQIGFKRLKIRLRVLKIELITNIKLLEILLLTSTFNFQPETTILK